MHRLTRFLLFPLLALLPTLGLLMSPGLTANSSVQPSHPSKAAAAAAIARAAIKDLSIGQHATDQQIGATKHVSALTQEESTNWSGYIDTGADFTEVNGTWVEPSVSCGDTTALAAFWVGLGGYDSDSLEQAGTLIECYEGTAYQYTWWEIYPSNDIQVAGESVESGDSIYAVVLRSGDVYTLTVTDHTHTASSFTTTQTYADGSYDSAEWIAEAPSSSSGVYPLADFSKWTLTSSSVANDISGVISSFPSTEVTMVDSSGKVEAQPSALNSGGSGFTVTWKSST
jgi:Peptidase A4 family